MRLRSLRPGSPRRGSLKPRAVRRAAAYGVLLAVTAVIVPDAGPAPVRAQLVAVDGARGVDHDAGVVWVLALGSDARPGENVVRSRADAIQLVGLDPERGRGVVIGIPRDSYVPIPGVGSDKINAALFYGGPQLMADTVADLVGIRADYVLVTDFPGMKAMVRDIGGITVYSDLGFTDPNMEGEIREGRNRLDGPEALFFTRARYYLPRGDFDRSAHQQEVLRGILREVRAHEGDPGFMERGALTALKHLRTDLGPRELYRFAHAVTSVEPQRFVGCVLAGSIGTAGAASVVFPDTAQAARLGDQARDDATFDEDC